MKVAIVTSTEPFVKGGAQLIVDSLERQLQVHGHDVDVLRIPVTFAPDRYLDQLLAFRLLDVAQWGERLIAIRPPSYLVEHPAKSVWFIHHWRYLVDLWDTKHGPEIKTAALQGLRDFAIRSDTAALHEARSVYANSQVVADRLKMYNNVTAALLYPPIEQPERFVGSEYGDYVLCVSRITPMKRQRLIVEAMQYVKSDVRLVLTGQADYPDESNFINRLIDQHRLADRVSFANSWVEETEKQQLIASCLANVYLPEDEDSYGYSTLEAGHARKATITTTDSGGVMEFVIDGENGVAVPPDARSLAEAFDRLYQDRSLAAKLGEAANQRITDLNITWENVVGALLR